MDSIEKRISRILVDQFKVDTTEIGNDTTLGELSIDSIVLIELALALDDAFGVELGDSELHDRMTISDAAGLIVARLDAGGKYYLTTQRKFLRYFGRPELSNAKERRSLGSQ